MSESSTDGRTPESVHRQRAEDVEMIVVVDSTARGPALGGCRWRSYADADAALGDARALARAMTRKAAMARLELGGGKAVVVGEPARRTRPQLLAFGAFVESLGGRYVTAADMGTGQEEMAVIRERTEHVVGLPARLGGCGDPGPFTALGVLQGIETSLAERDRQLPGARILVQGVGNVGSALVRQLAAAGAEVMATDTDRERLAALPPGVARVEPVRAIDTACDVLAPCGPPAVIGLDQIDALRCVIVAGAANNPLASVAVAAALDARGILYAPDFVINAGGLIHLAVAREGGDADASKDRMRVIPENLTRIYAQSRATGIDPARTAERLALDTV